MTHEKQERIQGQGGAKHTPGPWEAWNELVFGGPLTAKDASGVSGFTAEVAECSEDNGDDEDEGKEIAAANAKLIAAAPELADALAAMCKWIGPPPTDRESFDSAREDAWTAARAALRKAGRE